MRLEGRAQTSSVWTYRPAQVVRPVKASFFLFFQSLAECSTVAVFQVPAHSHISTFLVSTIDGGEDGRVLQKGLSMVCTGPRRISIGLDNRVHYDRDNPHDDGIFCRFSDAAVKLKFGSHAHFMAANDVFHLLNVPFDSTNIRWSSSLGGQAGNSRLNQKAYLDQGEM